MIILKIFAQKKIYIFHPETFGAKILENGEVEMKTEPLPEG